MRDGWEDEAWRRGEEKSISTGMHEMKQRREVQKWERKQRGMGGWKEENIRWMVHTGEER